MSSNFRSRFKGKKSPKKLNKLIVVVTEGEKTEPNYFRDLKELDSIVPNCNVKIHKCKKGGSAKELLEKMEYAITKEELESDDQAWIVVDNDEKDKYQKSEIDQLLAWRMENKDIYRLAVSNPNFEFWLLLHFDCDHAVRGGNDCENRLQVQLRNKLKNDNFVYNKWFPTKFINDENVWKAVDFAKNRDKTSIDKWPLERCTRVYKLIEVILKRKNTKS